MDLTRRSFLEISAAAAGVAVMASNALALTTLKPVVSIDSALEVYPDRGWEKVYHDQYRYDKSFTYVCSPNDTHQCRVRAFVRNGIIMRVESNYSHQEAEDLYGNKATRNWNPRMCLKGYTFHRKVYGPYRMKYPMVRKHWKQWADDGFPYLSKDLMTKYKFSDRASDEFVRMTWDEAFTYIAKCLVATAKRYSGEAGAQLLRDEGYHEEMIRAMKGAGTRGLKFRGGMGQLQVMGIYGNYRLSNMMAILDQSIRNIEDVEEALGGRNWTNYTWHGDQAPGHPFVHGIQASDIDMNDHRFSKLTIHMGKNLVENKMPEVHWMAEMMERGGKIVVVTPDYNPTASKADYWVPVRPSSDTALLLGITKILIDENLYDAKFVKEFTDFPLLVRTDNLKRLLARDVFPNYVQGLKENGYSFTTQGMIGAQYNKIGGDYVVWDKKTNSAKAITREMVGDKLAASGIDPVLEGTYTVKLVDGKEVPVMPLFQMYKVHLVDYDIDTVVEITRSPKELIQRLAHDIATIKPVSFHIGEGVNHYFHATLLNRATYLPLMLTGNLGKFGSGSHTWAGNYKAGNWQGSKHSGPGFYGWIGEDVFHPNLDENADGKEIHAHGRAKDEETGYWAHGDKPLVVNTPKYGRKNFTGDTHMPTPTKTLMASNVNIFNQAKWVYELFFNVNPRINMIIHSDVIITSTGEYSDIILAANTWVEKQVNELTSSCSNPFLEVWGGKTGITPIGDTKDDLNIQAGIAKALTQVTGDKRFADFYKFALEGKHDVYMQRLWDSSTTTRGYKVKDILAKGGTALLNFRTYPRQPFWEEVHESKPVWTDTGRFNAYCDIPEALSAGENFIVQREGPEATQYMQNVIVSTNPYIRPDDNGISLDAKGRDERTVRNIKMAWGEVKQTKNFLWEAGYRFWCVTPKTRHSTHSSWNEVDWNLIWASNFGDPYRMDKRMPSVGEHQVHIHPTAGKDFGIEDGDYIYVDANPADRPYVGWKPNEERYKATRCMLRAKYNPAYPYNVLMMKHGGANISTERTYKAAQTRPDGRALSKDTGYSSNFRSGSQQTLTTSWLMPMHQTDSLFHKKKVMMAPLFGFEGDNHGINTVPKEILVKVSKAEDGGIGGKGVWDPVKTGYTPGHESDFMTRYLRGELTTIASISR